VHKQYFSTVCIEIYFAVPCIKKRKATKKAIVIPLAGQEMGAVEAVLGTHDISIGIIACCR